MREAILRQLDVTVVIEACPSAGWLTDRCQSMGVPVMVASTNSEAWAWKSAKRKTDKDGEHVRGQNRIGGLLAK